jgi:hypothetical protein
MAYTLAAVNPALEPTPNSLRSYLAPAIGRGSPPAFGCKTRQSEELWREQEHCGYAHMAPRDLE